MLEQHLKYAIKKVNCNKAAVWISADLNFFVKEKQRKEDAKKKYKLVLAIAKKVNHY